MAHVSAGSDVQVFDRLQERVAELRQCVPTVAAYATGSAATATLSTRCTAQRRGAGPCWLPGTGTMPLADDGSTTVMVSVEPSGHTT